MSVHPVLSPVVHLLIPFLLSHLLLPQLHYQSHLLLLSLSLLMWATGKQETCLLQSQTVMTAMMTLGAMHKSMQPKWVQIQGHSSRLWPHLKPSIGKRQLLMQSSHSLLIGHGSLWNCHLERRLSLLVGFSRPNGRLRVTLTLQGQSYCQRVLPTSRH